MSTKSMRSRTLPTPTSSPTPEQILTERGKRYGEFAGHANITQALKDSMRQMRNWETLEDDQKEALEMISHKIGRILNGDPNWQDSWDDIAGYAKLVSQRLTKEQAE